MTSSQAIGMLGNNLHLANALTALYLATGPGYRLRGRERRGLQPGLAGRRWRAASSG